MMTSAKHTTLFGSLLLSVAMTAMNPAGAQQTEPAAKDAADKPAATAPSQKMECDDLKKKIEDKLEAKGVKGYQLDVVDADAATDAKVVGTCGGGKQKITYSRADKPAGN
jgi:hypothetical protein